jgi:DNA-binding transcriptional LysR family regulator
MDRLEAMRVFAAVADRGSFAEAARRVRLSPAAVTGAVNQLEDQLGLLLFARTTRSVRLTERGALYLDRCKQILDDIEDADRQIRGEDAAPRGRMLVAAPLMFGRLHVLPIVHGMLRDHRDLSIRLTLSDRDVHLIEEGIDVAVRIGEPADSALVAIKVGEVRRVLTASPDYLARAGVPESPSALSQHDLILFEGAELTNDWHFGGASPTSFRVEPRLSVNAADAAIAAAEAGFGITRTLSYQVYDALKAGRLRLVLEQFAPPPIPVNIVYTSRRLGSANVKAFIRAARAQLASVPMLASAGRSRDLEPSPSPPTAKAARSAGVRN